MEYIIIALLVGTLAVVLWQVISIRRLARVMDRGRDSQCEEEYSACRRECEKLLEIQFPSQDPFGLDQLVNNQCWIELSHAFLTCPFKPDQAAKEECFRDAQRRFQECLAQQNAASVDIVGIFPNKCHIEHAYAFLVCSFKPDLAAREECLREAERKFQACLMQQNPAYGACIRGCLEKRVDCHRKILQDATLGRREQLPSKPDLVEPPIPPIGPRAA
jgi:hypothetical protein